MGWEIVRHSFAMLYRNLGNALRISVGPLLIALVAAFLILGVFGSGVDTLTEEIEPDKLPPGLALAALLIMLLFVFVFAWIAVAWHRFILLEDYPGLLPPLAGRPVWRYLGKILLLFLVIMVLTIPAIILIAIFASVLMGPISPFILSTLNLGLVLYVSYMYLRFAIVLPATAVGRPMGFGDAWRVTSPYASAILGAGIIIMLINAAILMLSSVLPGLPALIVTVLANWISVMLGISILTTLYGVIVERRTLG
jgi:hypothetical protein